MIFPDITDIDFSAKGHENQEMRNALDYAVNQWTSRQERRARIEKLYNAYNGLVDKNEIDSIIKMTGKKSKTKYIKYRLGRSKMKQLHGEFLQIPIQAYITSVNREAKNERMQKYINMFGMSMGKPYIENLRQMGYNVFEGMHIPDRGSREYWAKNNFKLTNEIVMQHIIDDKLQNERLKAQFYQNFMDLTIAAEIFGKNERDVNGRDTYRYIPAKLAMYDELDGDVFLDRSPYLGEVRPMYYHEILTSKEFNLDKEQKKELELLKDSYDYSIIGGHLQKVNGVPLINVYTIEWKGLETVRVKVSPAKGSNVPYKLILDEKYFESNKKNIEKDVREGKYKIETYYREILWTSSRIGTTIYTTATKEDELIQILNENGKYNVDYNYSGMLFSTIDGYRVSLQEIILELEKIYDDVRFMINRELRKIKSDTLLYDDAFLPKGKQFIDVFHEISEDGVARYNSSAEGNRSGMESESNKVGINVLNFGQNQNLIVLMNHAMDIERVLDRITGMNDARQGVEKATTTATANTNNVEASRSMTYDLFYFMKEYMERVIAKLAEKTKLNWTTDGEDSRQFILSDEELQYLVATKNLMHHNYAATVTDGRKEQAILQKLEMLFPQEINAQNLRSKDVAKFLMQENFAKAIKILDEAYTEIETIRMEQSKVSQESEMKKIDTDLQISREDREDRQEHDKEMELLRTEGKKEIEYLKNMFKSAQSSQDNIFKGNIEQSKMQQENSQPSIFE